jgi:hypothetical protein
MFAGLSSMPGFPRRTRSLDASPCKVGRRFLRGANGFPIADDLKRG